MTRVTMRFALMIALAAILALTGCASSHKHLEQQQAMERWEALIRWSEFDALVDMIHPEWLEENPIQPIDIERLHQFRVTEYRVRQVLSDPDGDGFERIVQIRLYHRHTARERVINHREVWRYDEEFGVWLLHSGLPDPRQS